jgi:catalase
VLTGEEAVEKINERFGRHPGFRAFHAKGTLCRGTFTASPQARDLTRAVHMQGDPVDVTARFSNGAGYPRSRDPDPDVRGMAVTFHLPDGSRTDISAQTSPRFPSRTPEDFLEFVRISKPSPTQLIRLPLFLATHPEAFPSVVAGRVTLKPPASYVTLRYYAIHAFRWIDESGGSRYVRYTWVPAAGEQFVSRGEARKRGNAYLQEELRGRLERGPARFTLMLQIAAEGDEVNDATAAWPDDREKVEAGTLEVHSVTTEGDDFVFDPMRLADGIEPSDDPVLRFRPQAYAVSHERRTGAEAP